MINKIQYNKQDKILSIKLSDEHSVDSDVRGNVVVDYDKKGMISNIDIMDFSLDEFKEIPIFTHHPAIRDRFSVVREKA